MTALPESPDLSETRLQEIDARVNAVPIDPPTGAPMFVVCDSEEDWLVLSHARQDIPDLLAEVRRLQSALTAARAEREPRKLTQYPNGCWVACIAGLTGIEHAQLAAFIPDDESGRCDYNNNVNRLLRESGWRLQFMGPDVPRGFAIGSGLSPRGIHHAVIVKDGVLWHDPHPDRSGVVAFESFEVIVPIVDSLQPNIAEVIRSRSLEGQRDA